MISDKELAINIQIVTEMIEQRQLKSLADYNELIRLQKDIIQEQQTRLKKLSWRGMFKELTDTQLKLIIAVLGFSMLATCIYFGLSIDSIASIVKAIKC